MSSDDGPVRRTSAVLTGIYTLTPTHCGTGQTTGAIDLPIARESHTGLPVLPATSLKGVARHALKDVLDGNDGTTVKELFGPETSVPDHEAGGLIVGEGKLLALPVRSHNRTFFYATCPLILERLHRDVRAYGVDLPSLPEVTWTKLLAGHGVQVSDPALRRQTLVLEDFVYRSDEIDATPEVRELGTVLTSLLPSMEADTRTRLQDSLVVIADEELADLARRTPPVQARIQLTSGKTTSRYRGADGREESGNLWYEETLPSDCLLYAFLSERRQTRAPTAEGGSGGGADRSPLEKLKAHAFSLRDAQMGGNETVGQGRIWWTFVGWEKSS